MTHPAALSNTTAFISGGCGAIASECAHLLAEDGATVLLMDLRADALEATKVKLRTSVPNAKVETFAGDALCARDVEHAIQSAFAIQNRLDIVVSTVGGGHIRPLLLHDVDSFRAEMDLNLISAFLAIRYGAPKMAAGGSIVLLSSTAAKKAPPWMSAYSVGKASVDALMRSAAEELAEAKIRVNAVRPGLTRSEMTASTFSHARTLKATLDQIPLGRAGEPVDIANAIRYLAGSESAWVTGQSFAVDGGTELRKSPNFGGAVAHIYGQDVFEAVKRGKLP